MRASVIELKDDVERAIDLTDALHVTSGSVDGWKARINCNARYYSWLPS